MNKKPNFDLSDIINSDCLNKCKDFIPKFKKSSEELVDKNSHGSRDNIIDSNIELCSEGVNNDIILKEDDTEQIVLDVGIGVYDVNGELPNDEKLASAGVTIVDVDKHSMILKEEEPFITEIDNP